MRNVRNLKFRLYPSYTQWKKLDDTLGTCRWVYNHFVEQTQKSFLSRNEMNYLLTELKQQEPWLYNYHSKMLQMVSTQIDGAQKALIELRKKGHKTGKIRFVKYNEYRTFTYNQSGFKLEEGWLYLSKIGKIKIVLHRQIPENVEIIQIVVTRSKSGKWFACITCEFTTHLPKINFKNSIGIDVGIKHFVYDSQGCQTPNPLNLQKMLKPLARVQRKIARRKPGSNNRKKAVKWYQIIHERIKNRRKDFLHKLSTQYSKRYNVVFVERLTKLNMIKNHRMARNILDSGWGIFTNMLDYKCKVLIEIPARNTTIDCSRCGNSVPKSLAVRTHRCNVCGLTLDRDHNAALNILQRGLNIFEINLPQELWKVTPVEITKRSKKQEEVTGLVR